MCDYRRLAQSAVTTTPPRPPKIRILRNPHNRPCLDVSATIRGLPSNHPVSIRNRLGGYSALDMLEKIKLLPRRRLAVLCNRNQVRILDCIWGRCPPAEGFIATIRRPISQLEMKTERPAFSAATGPTTEQAPSRLPFPSRRDPSS